MKVRSIRFKVPGLRKIGLGVVTLVLILHAAPAKAQYCMNYAGSSLFDTSPLGCAATPDIDRTFFPGTIHWNDNELLIHSTGNDLSIWNIQDPAYPEEVGSSDFQVGNEGDSDHDLQTWAACDDCRYGLAAFKLGAVVFDLGTDDMPSFLSFQTHTQYTRLERALTFSHQGHQYLVAQTIQNTCDDGVGLFLFNGTDLDSLHLLECVEGPAGTTVPSRGGLYLQSPGLNNGTAYLWLHVGANVQIFRVDGTGDGLSLSYVASPTGMEISTTAGLAVDLENNVVVTLSGFSTFEMKTWKMFSLENPFQVGSLDVQGNMASLAYPWVWLAPMAQMAQHHSGHTVDISNPWEPHLREDQFWSGDNPWNQLPCWGAEAGGTFSDDGAYLFLSRWEQLQQFDFRQCLDDPSIIFVDRFETGDSSQWQATVQGLF